MADSLLSKFINPNHELSATLLFDIKIECLPEDATNSTLDGLRMTVLDGGEVSPDPQPTDRLSPTTWEYQGIIELYPDMGRLVIVVQSDEAGDFGFLDLTAQTSHYLGSQASQAAVPKHKVVTDEGKPSLWMAFAASVAGQEQDPQHLSAPRQSGIAKLSETTTHKDQLSSDMHFVAGATLLQRGLDTGDVSQISQATEKLQLAVALTPEGHYTLPARLASLGASSLMLVRVTGNPADTANAIKHLEKSVELIPDDHPIMPSCLNTLGESLLTRFEQTANAADIATAIKHLQKSAVLTPEGNPVLPSILNTLGNSFLTRFEQKGNLADITTAIEHYQKSVVLTPKGDASIATYLSNLGNSFTRRFGRTGDLTDIAAAIEHHQRSLKQTPEWHSDLPTQLSNLAMSFMARFERTRDLDDLASGLEYQKKSVRLTPEGHPRMLIHLNNLESALSRRYETTGELDDIEAAIQHYQRLVGLTQKGHPALPMLLSNLANSFSARFKHTADLNHINVAIEYHQRSVGITLKGHPAMPMHLHNFGNSLWARFEQTEDLADITAAIDHQQNAVDLSPEGRADEPGQRARLGGYLMARFRRTNDIGDCQSAARNFRLAAIQNTGKPSLRLAAAREWAICCGELKDYATERYAYGTAVELLCLVASLDQTIHHRHSSLVGMSKLAREAVAWALWLGGINDVALEWSEQGRCLIWAQLNQLRTPVDLLREYDVQLADRFLLVSKALETSGSRPETSWRESSTINQQIAVEDQVRSQLKLAREFEQLLVKIRELPHFNDFLRPPKASNILSQLPKDGPVVVINTYRSHCDALALVHGAEEPIHIRLNNFTLPKAESLRNQLGYHLTSEKHRMRDSNDRGGRLARRPDTGLRHILQELWNGVVWPILQGLGYTSPPAHRNRIWWCATGGPLAFLPIHAAGIYNPDAKVPRACISDFAVSSYIPTVTTLLEKLNTETGLKRQETKLFLLSQPNALAHAPIPGTVEETRSVQKQMREADIAAVLLEDEEGTKDRVREEIGTHGWIHIASHASQHPTEPLKSGFYLHDGQLELLEIIRQQLPSADFAFLSACQTSVGNEKLSEEAVHLAAGVLAAGYQGVVATMWSIKDQYAPKIAQDFYGFLLREKRESSAPRLDSRRAAYALDDATRKIRAKLGDSEYALLTWVPYIHHGL